MSFLEGFKMAFDELIPHRLDMGFVGFMLGVLLIVGAMAVIFAAILNGIAIF